MPEPIRWGDRRVAIWTLLDRDAVHLARVKVLPLLIGWATFSVVGTLATGDARDVSR